MEPKTVKYSPSEKIVMDAIAEKGEFVWDQNSHPQLKRVLKELMWKEFIVRKKDKGLYGNVFVHGWFKELIIKDRDLAEILNK